MKTEHQAAVATLKALQITYDRDNNHSTWSHLQAAIDQIKTSWGDPQLVAMESLLESETSEQDRALIRQYIARRKEELGL